MRLPALILSLLLSPSLLFAQTPTPEIESRAGRQAFADLATLYADGKPLPNVDQAFKDLASNTPATREAAANYIAALLYQSLADESNGRAQWRALPFWGGDRSSASRVFREKLANQIATGPSAPELLNAQLWLINSEVIPENALLGAQSLTRNPSPSISQTYKLILQPAHKNAKVLVLILKNIADRQLTDLDRQVIALAQDPRLPVRQAARKTAAALKLPPPLGFNPETALTGIVEFQLKSFSSTILTPIPKDAQWKRFISNDKQYRGFSIDEFSGWLLSKDAKSLVVIDYFGQERTLDASAYTVADRTFADDAKYFYGLRNPKPPAPGTQEDLFPENPLSSGGAATGQFQPGLITAPEALVAAWAFERGDKKTAAIIYLPILNNTVDLRSLSPIVRNLVVTHYHQEMLEAFTYQRDYQRVIQIADHLAKPVFAGWPYYERTKELRAQLANRTDDFKTLTLPTPEEWTQLQTKLDRSAQIKYLCDRLRLLNGFQWGQPGGVDFRRPQTREPKTLYFSDDKQNTPKPTYLINPLVELSKLKIIPREIPILVPYLDDRNFVLAFGYWRDFHPNRTLYRVNEFVISAINTAAGRTLIAKEDLDSTTPEELKAIKEAALQWSAANINLTRNQLLLASLKDATRRWDILTPAHELVQNKELAAIPLLLQHIDKTQDVSDKGEIAECCYYLAPQLCLAQARQWVKSPDAGDLKLWGALILFKAGDASRNEGVEELKSTLPHRSDYLYYRDAMNALITSPHPEALNIAATILTYYDRRALDKWTLKPYLHKLILAGRQDTLDYLLKKLDDNEHVASTTATIDGKQTEIKITIADNIAVLLSELRTDKYEYPRYTSPETRSAELEKLKPWLRDQFTLIRQQKPSAFQPLPTKPPIPHWLTNDQE